MWFLGEKRGRSGPETWKDRKKKKNLRPKYIQSAGPPTQTSYWARQSDVTERPGKRKENVLVSSLQEVLSNIQDVAQKVQA